MSKYENNFNANVGSINTFDNKLIKECMFNILELSKQVAELKSRLNDIENPKRCECILKGYEPGKCRKRLVCSETEKPYHTEKCWTALTTPYSDKFLCDFEFLCTCEEVEEKEDEAYDE